MSLRRVRRRRRRALIGATLAVVVLGGGAVLWATSGDDAEPGAQAGAVAPAPSTTTTTVVTSPEQIVPPAGAEATTATLVRVERAIRAEDRDPERLRVLGWEQQLAYRQLSNHADWLPAVLGALQADVAPWVQANLDASGALSALTPPQVSLPDWDVLTPEPAAALRGYYAEAEAATGISWAYLAAIHFLETRMGRIHGNSTAGAQGPMQFIPSTWAAYGNGGDVNDDRDAINAAARYLKAAGGPADMDRAIFAYNHDRGYVSSVKAYAQNLLADPRAYDGYYHWQVYYRTTAGTVLLPEGYTPPGPVGARFLPPA
ncbi:MAG: transglycosylase SLT domain-containing protein [Actinomycetota bacterium]